MGGGGGGSGGGGGGGAGIGWRRGLYMIIYAGQIISHTLISFACYICIFIIMAATLQQADSYEESLPLCC